MKKVKMIGIILLACMLLPIMSFAADQKITSVSISIRESKAEAGEVYEAEPNVSSAYYEIADISLSKDYDSWKPGSKVTYSIILEPKEGYRFDTQKIKNISVTGGTIAGKEIKSGKISVKINYIPKVTLSAPENIYFADEYIAVWDKVTYCNRYEVEVLKENEDGVYKKHQTVKVDKNQIDLSTYATDEHDITFKVRAIPKDTESTYLKASDWVDANGETSSGMNTIYGSFVKTSNGDITFKGLDGNFASGWHRINDAWYYFHADNGNKAIVASWAKIGDSWYAFDQNGIMRTGWFQTGGYWYYLNTFADGTEGSMRTGWLKTEPNGPWYYLQVDGGLLPEGAMYTNTITPDGYNVNDSGVWTY